MTAILMSDTGIVTCSDIFTTERVGAFDQCFPFDVRIAEHTWIGCAASDIFIYKIVDDIIPKFLTDIHDKMVESHFDRYLAGIVDAVQAAAAGFLLVASTGGIIPGFHR